MSADVRVRSGLSSAPDGQIIGVYGYIVEQGTLESVESAAADLGMDPHQVVEAAADLTDRGLLRPDPCTRRLVPVDPQVASALLIAPIEREIYVRRDRIDRLRERLERMARAHPRQAEPPAGSIDRLAGSAEIRGLLEQAGDVCRKDVLVLRSDEVRGDVLDDFLEGCGDLLGRGVSVLALCTHRCRADFAVRARTTRLVEDGVEVRTVSRLARTAIVFDRSVAVLFGPAEGREVTAWRVREENVVSFLAELLDQQWDEAIRFEPGEPAAAEVADDLRQDIARLMAKGLTDEAVARRLGMSVRTCRRHIAALLRSLDSVSRFQAGAEAARRLVIASGQGPSAEPLLASNDRAQPAISAPLRKPGLGV